MRHDGVETVDVDVTWRLTNASPASRGRWCPPGPGVDPEVLVREVLEAPIRVGDWPEPSALDRVDLSIFLHKLDSIIDDGRDVCKYLSMAEALQAGDLGVGVFTAKGDLAGMSTGVVLHTLLHYGPVKYVLKHYANDPTVGLEDGDIFFFNDPDGGGVHTYDHFLMMPLFYKDELISWVGLRWSSGRDRFPLAGRLVAAHPSRYEEGLHVSPLRVGRNSRVRQGPPRVHPQLGAHTAAELARHEGQAGGLCAPPRAVAARGRATRPRIRRRRSA